jgi:hypothetical protein
MRQSEEQEIESAGGENEEADEYEEVQRAGDPVAWMLPLSEPELQKFLHSQPRPVETKIALGPDEWCNTLCHDVEKAGEPQELYQKKQC